MVGGNLKFVHIGYDYVLCANRIIAVFPPNSHPTRRMMRFAKTNDSYIDMTKGRETRSYILLEDGTLVGCAFNSITVLRRLNEESPMGGVTASEASEIDTAVADDDETLDEEDSSEVD